MRTLKFDKFRIEIKTIETNSNYNLSVSMHDKNGLLKGTILKENTSDEDILKFFFQEEKDKLSKTEYEKLRDSIYQDLISSGVTSDEDENYKAFDDVLGNNLNVDWGNESVFRVGLYDDADEVLIYRLIDDAGNMNNGTIMYGNLNDIRRYVKGRIADFINTEETTTMHDFIVNDMDSDIELKKFLIADASSLELIYKL